MPLTPNEKRGWYTLSLDIIKPLMEGVATMHAGKVLHRDIKPANCMLSTREGKLLSQVGTADVPIHSDIQLARL